MRLKWQAHRALMLIHWPFKWGEPLTISEFIVKLKLKWQLRHVQRQIDRAWNGSQFTRPKSSLARWLE